MRTYGITNAAPYASAPAVGLLGDTYWNTTESALYASDGAAWNKIGPAGASSWTDSGTTLTPNPNTRTVSIPGGAAGAGSAALLLGSNPPKVRLQTDNTAVTPWVALSLNRDAMTGVIDDTSKPAWQQTMNASADNWGIARQPAGGSYTQLLILNNLGMLNVPGPATGMADFTDIQFGSRTAKGRLMAIPNLDWIGLTKNAKYGGSTPAWTVDDTTIATWLMSFAQGDSLLVQRAPPNSTTFSAMLNVDSAGNLSIGGTFSGNSLTNATVTAAKLAPGAAVRQGVGTSFRYAAATNVASTTLVRILGSASITTSGGRCLICVNLDGRYYPVQTGVFFLVVEVQRSGTNIYDWITEYEIPAGSFNHAFGVGGLNPIVDNPSPGTYTYDVYVRMNTTSQIYKTGSYSSSTIQVYELA